jgi:hypothetical protein
VQCTMQKPSHAPWLSARQLREYASDQPQSTTNVVAIGARSYERIAAALQSLPHINPTP